MRTRAQVREYLSMCHATWARPRHTRGPQRGQPVAAFACREEGERVAELLEHWRGLHHFDSRALGTADWSRDHVYLGLHYPTLDTFDSNELTRLVFLAHDLAIRVEVTGKRDRIQYLLTPRARTGGVWSRHPMLEDAVRRHREVFPAELIYRDPSPQSATTEAHVDTGGSQ